ncbi:putative competence lipoprotein precursor [Thiobacillus denitrificans ATCC 25259]|uniref:Outer membrane protein assembly factor BamD n=1 Tax=Thiobacillus denitrificans (strain ATCC 25259 / T1) TaxID=292415 RepID=Q3SKL7_THIDA|nr:outer membrane protein assembly factor BamD [Thiobacillus denitrificans]AAZ96762.1 putative competence lipoprotein precursor [Thiobacillus denitrificans ATCC 25259]
MLEQCSSRINAFVRSRGLPGAGRAALLAAALALGGCGLLPEVKDETTGWSAQKLYAEAKDNLNEGNYERAVKLFETLESRYPFGRYAQQAQLEVAYAYYKDNEPISAVAACDRFIKLHPNHPNVDYAYYLKGLANFNDDLGLLGNLVDQDMSERDPRAARDAFLAFKELATRFPQSIYAADATARMKYLVNALANNEVHVAKYYLKRKAYVAAANRAKEVLKTYPEAPALEEALAIMALSYDRLKLPELRDDARRVLTLNFPNSKYLQGVSIKEKAWYRFW